jgi:hypothetical protein
MELRNVGVLPQHYTASQPRRPGLEVPIYNLLYIPIVSFVIYGISRDTC